jgi:hypothetical protein
MNSNILGFPDTEEEEIILLAMKAIIHSRYPEPKELEEEVMRVNEQWEALEERLKKDR